MFDEQIELGVVWFADVMLSWLGNGIFADADTILYLRIDQLDAVFSGWEAMASSIDEREGEDVEKQPFESAAFDQGVGQPR